MKHNAVRVLIQCHSAPILGRIAVRLVYRRSTPERIFQARRDAIRNILTGSGMPLEAAERWCDAWELEAAGRGLPRNSGYWIVGAEWIVAERAARRLGCT